MAFPVVTRRAHPALEPVSGRSVASRAALLAAAVVAASGLAASTASAAPSPLPGLDAVFVAPRDSGALNTSLEVHAGEGRGAYTTWKRAGVTIHGIEGTATRVVTTVPGKRPREAAVESVGTDRAGHPVAILRRALRGAPADRRAVVRLDTGAFHELHVGLPPRTKLLAVAVDHGLVRYATGPKGKAAERDYSHYRSRLLSGRLEGTTVTKNRVLHRFAPGFQADVIVAQQHRVAVADSTGQGRTYAGGPGVAWRLLAQGKDTKHAFHDIHPIGFTTDGSALVTHTEDSPEFEGEFQVASGMTLTARPLSGAAAVPIDVGVAAPLFVEAISWDETSNRALVQAHPGDGQDSSLPTVIGYTAPLTVR